VGKVTDVAAAVAVVVNGLLEVKVFKTLYVCFGLFFHTVVERKT